ncbi:hypothetical protein [Paractinoplanes toevensis]|uniref:Uncharacterized protein n=1 Tax=Paractinoplanes toevensis TaxID=571911 RepID=A0A919T545_9ACTN|nr:hypothetical protein [Actinoplanes toevensis]GIM88837.1 hypothetical protein Ato02nite_006300 [Actinoplanes toevensis]
MTEPWEEFECDQWTPNDAEKALRWVLRAMHNAQQGLRDARDAEVTAKHEYEREKRKAFFAPDCPKPARGGHTVADRDAFIEQSTALERERYELAQATTAAAQDHLRTLNSQSVVMSALAKNVQQTFAVVGAR